MEMKCEVCFHPFSIRKHRPRCLPCGHSFCSLCLKKIVNDKVITCPTCRQFYEINHLEQIPINYSVEKLLRNDNGVKLFSEIEDSNGRLLMETCGNYNEGKSKSLLNVDFDDAKSNSSSGNSTTGEFWWLGKNDGRSCISFPSSESLTSNSDHICDLPNPNIRNTNQVWWLGKNNERLNSPVDYGTHSQDFDLSSRNFNSEIYCRNHNEDVKLYCLNHKEWICNKCTEEQHRKFECTIITKEEEIRGRRLESQSNQSSGSSNNIWWVGKEQQNNVNENVDQAFQEEIPTNRNEMVSNCKIHHEMNVYFCLNHEEWTCHLCTLVTHPKHECNVIAKDEELKRRKFKFYELNFDTNCLIHNKEIVLYCLNHKKWICQKCTNTDHPKHECTVISKEEELRGRKIETKGRLQNCIIKYENLIHNLQNLKKYFVSNKKRKNINGKLCMDEVKHEDRILRNILDQAEENKWSLELRLESLCTDNDFSEVSNGYNNITEYLSAMLNWEQQQQHWLAQQIKHTDRTYSKGDECQTTAHDREKEELTSALNSSRIKLQLSEEIQLSLKQQLLEMEICTEKISTKLRNVFVLSFIICLSVIVVSLWFINSATLGRIGNDSRNVENNLQMLPKRFNESQNKDVILQTQEIPKNLIGKICINNSNKNKSISILEVERKLIDSLDQKYKLQNKYDEALRQFKDYQLKTKEVLEEKNEIIRKLKISISKTNETKPLESSRYDYSFIENYLQHINYVLSLSYESFYWALRLNLSFISFFIAIYVTFSFDNWLSFLTQQNYKGKFSYFLFIIQVYLTFCEINCLLTWITSIESKLNTPSIIPMLSNSMVSSWVAYFVTLLIGALATGISALLADGIGNKMKSSGYHSDYCHFTIVVTWFLLLKEFSMVISLISANIVS